MNEQDAKLKFLALCEKLAPMLTNENTPATKRLLTAVGPVLRFLLTAHMVNATTADARRADAKAKKERADFLKHVHRGRPIQLWWEVRKAIHKPSKALFEAQARDAVAALPSPGPGWLNRKQVKAGRHCAYIRAHAEEFLSENLPGTYAWGAHAVPGSMVDPHFALIGKTGSGKTILIEMLLLSVFRAQKRNNLRLLIFDPKKENYSVLCGPDIGLRAPTAEDGEQPDQDLYLLNPYDQRTARWNIAEDIATRVDAAELAQILAPRDPNERNPFFPDSARDLLRGVLVVLTEKAPRRWTLHDIFAATSSRKTLKDFLALGGEEGRLLHDAVLSEDGSTTSANIFSTLRQILAIYEDIARIWERTKHSVSLSTDWYEKRKALMLGWNPAAPTALARINQAIFHRAAQLLLAQERIRPDVQSWFFIDEARELAPLPLLRTLLNEGRDRGAHVVLGFQDIHGWRAAWGLEASEEKLAATGNMAVLALSNPDTEEWASNYFGGYEYWQASYSEQTSRSGLDTTRSSSVSRQIIKRQNLLPEFFRNLPQASPDDGISGAFQVPALGAWTTHVIRETIQKGRPKRLDPRTGFLPRSSSDQRPLDPGASRVAELLRESGSKPATQLRGAGDIL